MADAQLQPRQLTDIQLHFLRFFSERNVPEQETIDLQRLIALYYAQKADAIMDNIWSEKGLSNDKMKEILEMQLHK